MKKPKALPARIFQDIPYVLAKDILRFHGKKWSDKFSKEFCGSTGIVVPANDPSHNLSKEQFGIYYWDYENIRDYLNRGFPYFWD